MRCDEGSLTAKVREGATGGCFIPMEIGLASTVLELARRIEQNLVVMELLSRTLVETPPSARWCTEVNMSFGSVILHSNPDPASGSY